MKSKTTSFNESQKKVLLISYYYVPSNLSGVYRILRFSKYLPDNSWIPYILTTKESEGMRNVDHNLYKEIDSNTKIFRTITADPQLLFFKHTKNYLPKSTSIRSKRKRFSNFKNVLRKFKGGILRFCFFPDPQIFWFPFAFIKGYRLVRRNNIKVIFATGSPWTDFLVGYFLSIFTGAKLVLDYRDLWTSNKVIGFPTKLHSMMAKKIESVLIKRASKVISVTELMTQKFIKQNPGLAERFITITNGFDSNSAVLNYIYDSGITKSHSKNKFKIYYSGTFYLKRSPKTFLQALHNLFVLHPELRQDIEFVFIGDDYQGVLQNITSELGLSDIVKKKDFMSYSETHVELFEADVVVLIIPPHYKEEFTGKVFEYFLTKKPILAVVPSDGVAADLIRTTKTGTVADVENVDKIADAICQFYNQWKAGGIVYNRNENEIDRFNMKLLTGKLSAVLDSIVQ